MFQIAKQQKKTDEHQRILDEFKVALRKFLNEYAEKVGDLSSGRMWGSGLPNEINAGLIVLIGRQIMLKEGQKQSAFMREPTQYNDRQNVETRSRE